MTTEVWVCESGEYENRGINLVAATLQAAIAAIKARYGPPYVVRWDEPKLEKWGDWSLTGHFEVVPGYSIQYTDYFEFVRWDVEQETPPS